MNYFIHEALVFLMEGARLDLYLLNNLLLGRFLPFPEVLKIDHGGRIEKMKCTAGSHSIKVSDVFIQCILFIAIVRFGVRREFSPNQDCQGLFLPFSKDKGMAHF